jgi:UDP-N-acetylmuramoyl-L-alanyl-D-glutamate--2,6-diaminopimelate ligase
VLTLSEFLKLLPADAIALRPLSAADSRLGLPVTGIAQSSDLVQPGGVFCALPGERVHGLKFAAAAVRSGASAVLLTSPTDDLAELMTLDVAVYEVPGLRALLGGLAAAVYGTSEAEMLLLAVTGTNGKTSTVSYLQRLLDAAGVRCGLSASTERIVSGELQAANLTTPEVCELHELLAKMRLTDRAAAIEVSAQALVRERVDGIVFDVAGFTNLSRDHLDDFGSMGSYLAAKLELFTPTRSRRAVVFLADDFAREVSEITAVPVTTVGSGADWDYQFLEGHIALTRGALELSIPWAASELMARNFALAFVMLVEAGLDPQQLALAAGQVDPLVSGRLERVAAASIDGYVDYAHTPAAIESAIATLAHYPWVTVVFGASGDRDAGKRPAMAEAAAKADFVVVTDQHPRSEDPAEIRSVLASRISELKSETEFAEIADPEAACAEAVRRTPSGGALLWCGPGHLTYREIAGTKTAFSAREVLRRAIEND